MLLHEPRPGIRFFYRLEHRETPVLFSFPLILAVKVVSLDIACAQAAYELWLGDSKFTK